MRTPGFRSCRRSSRHPWPSTAEAHRATAAGLWKRITSDSARCPPNNGYAVARGPIGQIGKCDNYPDTGGYDDVLVLPAISKKIIAYNLLTGGTAQVKQTDQGITIRVPAEHRSELDTIVALELDGSTAELKPQRVDWGPLTFSRPVKASHKYDRVARNAWRYVPTKAVDGDSRTGWTVNPDVKSAWLEVDLEKEVTFDRAMIDEPLGRVRKFVLQVKNGDVWKTFYTGGAIGKEREIRFPATTGRQVRFKFTDATANPLIREFHLF